MVDFGNIKDLKTVYVLVDEHGNVYGSPFILKDSAEAAVRFVKGDGRIVEMNVTPKGANPQ